MYPVSGHKDIIATKAGSGKSQLGNKSMMNASAGRVMSEAKKSVENASNPVGRTSYVAGCKTAGVKNKY